MPLRLQRRRAKGYHLPETAICVTRPGPLGNMFVVGKDGSAAYCVDLYTKMLNGYIAISCSHETYEAQIAARKYIAEHRDELRDRDLACWCRLCPEHKAGKPFGLKCAACAPCHGDPLGMFLNVGGEEVERG